MRQAALLLVLLAACSNEDASSLRRDGTPNPAADSPAGGGDEPAKPNDPATCAPARKLVGFGGRDLAPERLVENAGVDRHRVKPYDVLAGEYARVLGKTPASLAAADTTFGSPPPRWFDEPNVSGTVMFAAFRISYDGCLDAAEQTCAAFQRKAWSRTPTPEEIGACDALKQKEGWPTACAAVLTSGGFITY